MYTAFCTHRCSGYVQCTCFNSYYELLHCKHVTLYTVNICWVLPCLARECDCPQALGLLGHLTVVPSSPHSLSPVRAPAHLPRFCSITATSFQKARVCFLWRASDQHPRVCARLPRFCSISAPAHWPRFFSKSARVLPCLFNNRAYVLPFRASFQNPRSCSLSALLFNIRACVPCRASVQYPPSCSLAAFFFKNPQVRHLAHFCSTSTLVLTCCASVQISTLIVYMAHLSSISTRLFTWWFCF